MYHVCEKSRLIRAGRHGKQNFDSFVPRKDCHSMLVRASDKALLLLTRFAIPNYCIQSAHKVCKYGVDMVESGEDGNDIRAWMGIFLGQKTREENA